MKTKDGNRVREILCKRRINEINNLIKNFVDDSTLLPLYCAKYTTLNKLDKLQSDIFICISKDYQLLLASKQVLDDGKTFNDLKLKLECDITGYISVFMENIISTRANIINIWRGIDYMEKENKVIYNPNEIYGTNSQSKYSVSEVKEMCDEVRKILNKGEMNMENKWKNEGLVMLIKSKKELECYCRTRRVINELIPNIDNLFVSIDELKQEAKTGVSVPDDFTFKNIITLVKDFNKSIDEHQDDRWDVDFITISCDNELTQLIETHNIHGHNIDSYDYAILMLNENDSREIPMVVLKSRCIIDYYTELREKPALPFDGIDDTLIGLLVRIPTTMYSVYQDDILDKDLTYMVKSLSSKLKNLEVVRFPELKDKYPDSDNYELINVINEIIEDIEFDVINLSTSLFRLPSSGVNKSINKVIKNYNAKFPMYHLIGILYLVKHDGRYFISSTDMNCQKVLMDNLEHHDLPMLLSFYCTNFEEVYSVNRSMISEMIEKTFNEFNVIYCKDINEILCNEIYSDDMVYISNKIPQKINKTGYIISRVFTNLKPNPENELGGFIPKASPSVNLESITYAQYIVLLYRHELDIYYGFIKSRDGFIKSRELD